TARTVILAAVLGILIWLCFRRSGSLRVASITALIAYFTGWTNYGMRPQLLAFLPFVVFLLLLEQKDERPQWLPLLTPVLLFWVNVHGSFFLCVALMAIYALPDFGFWILDFGFARSGNPKSKIQNPKLLWQLVCFAAAGLATLANPYFMGIYN